MSVSDSVSGEHHRQAHQEREVCAVGESRVRRMINLTINIVDHGWLEAVVNSDEHNACVTASYLTDAPANLLVAVAILVEGQREARCIWQEEPGEYRWVLRREGNTIRIQILWFESTYSNQDDMQGQVIFAGQDELIPFGESLIAAISKYSIENYKKIWGYDFPLQEIDRLTVAVKQ